MLSCLSVSKRPTQAWWDTAAWATLAWPVGCISLWSYYCFSLCAAWQDSRTRNPAIREHLQFTCPWLQTLPMFWPDPCSPFVSVSLSPGFGICFSRSSCHLCPFRPKLFSRFCLRSQFYLFLLSLFFIFYFSVTIYFSSTGQGCVLHSVLVMQTVEPGWSLSEDLSTFLLSGWWKGDLESIYHATEVLLSLVFYYLWLTWDKSSVSHALNTPSQKAPVTHSAPYLLFE